MLFSKEAVSDWQVGAVPSPDLSLSVAVAASSAFPPFLSPYVPDLTEAPWQTQDGNTYTGAEFRGRLSLSDGGVYDNLGLETAWRRCRRILASDAGGQLAVEGDPHNDWGRHMVRVLKVVDGQVRTLRRRQILDALGSGERDGVYLGIRTDLADCPVADPLPASYQLTQALARTPTRLTETPDRVRHGLVNWGYALCDGWLRAKLDPGAVRGVLPYDDAPLTDPETHTQPDMVPL